MLVADHQWRHGLDAFNDVPRGGFDTPEEDVVLRSRHAEVSRRMLGRPESARQLDLRPERCHPSDPPWVRRELRAALGRRGPTVFDGLVAIIRDHGPGGREARARATSSSSSNRRCPPAMREVR